MEDENDDDDDDDDEIGEKAADSFANMRSHSAIFSISFSTSTAAENGCSIVGLAVKGGG